MMGPALPPGAVGQEMLACGLLGGVLGAARAVRRAVRRRGRVAVLPSEKAAEEREGRGLAVLLVVAVGRVDALKVFGAAESAHHLVGDVVKVLVGDAHALHHLVHLRQSQALGALQAQTLVNGLVPLHPGDEHRGDILFTSGTKCWLHSYLRIPGPPDGGSVYRDASRPRGPTAVKKRSK